VKDGEKYKYCTLYLFTFTVFVLRVFNVYAVRLSLLFIKGYLTWHSLWIFRWSDTCWGI